MSNQYNIIKHFVEGNLIEGIYYYQDEYVENAKIQKFQSSTYERLNENQPFWSSTLNELSELFFRVTDSTFPISRGFIGVIKLDANDSQYVTLCVSCVMPYYAVFIWMEEGINRVQITNPNYDSYINNISAIVTEKFSYERIENTLLNKSIGNYSIDGVNIDNEPNIYNFLFSSDDYIFTEDDTINV